MARGRAHKIAKQTVSQAHNKKTKRKYEGINQDFPTMKLALGIKHEEKASLKTAKTSSFSCSTDESSGSESSHVSGNEDSDDGESFLDESILSWGSEEEALQAELKSLASASRHSRTSTLMTSYLSLGGLASDLESFASEDDDDDDAEQEDADGQFTEAGAQYCDDDDDDESVIVEGQSLEETLKQLQLSAHKTRHLTEIENDPSEDQGGDEELDGSSFKSLFKNRAELIKCIQYKHHRTAKTQRSTRRQKKKRTPAAVLSKILQWPTEAYPASMWDDKFPRNNTNENDEAYTVETINAIRAEDYTKLRSIMGSNNKSFQCANKHGESIAHLACRRATSDTLIRFLVEEAGMTLRVRDDVGRTPLHDCCWTYNVDNSRFGIFKAIVESCPELLFVRDRRDCSAFDYIPCDCWDAWCDYLEANADFIQKAVTKAVRENVLVAMEKEYRTFWKFAEGEKKIWKAKHIPGIARVA